MPRKHYVPYLGLGLVLCVTAFFVALVSEPKLFGLQWISAKPNATAVASERRPAGIVGVEVSQSAYGTASEVVRIEDLNRGVLCFVYDPYGPSRSPTISCIHAPTRK